ICASRGQVRLDRRRSRSQRFRPKKSETEKSIVCGIAGIVRWDGGPIVEDDIRAMCQVMVHRGPDEEGVYLGHGVALGMRRLSIIDLEGGQQPVSNEDGTIWVVFNGEIYNYRELRRELARNGHALRTESDTEVIVHLY